MCGRYTSSQRKDHTEDLLAGLHALRIELTVQESAATERYNVAPTEQVLAVIAPKGEPEPELMRWGLVPSWAKDLKSGPLMINARLETVMENGAFKRLVPKGSRRALVVADGWYEWLHAEKRGEPRQPFRFTVDDGAVFGFAGLWTPAKIDGSWLHSVTILTCDSASNRVAAAVHDRMPVVLADRDQQVAWLDPGVGVEVLDVCGPISADRVAVNPANLAVNKAGVEGPELLVL